ncbi:alpha/beta hydrolase [Maribacter algarum]|uniref:Alpha/beta hydrolase n=1 Tax=Maribacter algarum (ex Zhang et al. 2020) TaxID=2578118 RepID=A0A5S3PTV4_9FLAO|nr:alpha/beta fold hydrolase [Maribacter algarum]TMM57353.1 alpha/beta hydrolase [Maribacter algarum]
MKKKLKRFALAVLLLTIIPAFVGVHFVAPYIIIQPARVSLKTSPEDFGITNKCITLTTDDQLELVGYHIPSQKNETTGVMILVHGVGGCKEHFVELGTKLAKIGIATMVFDERAHGESDGEYCTYGYYEKNDISKIVDYIKDEYGDIPLGIWGNSLGGAVAIQALENDNRIEFGIIESTFTDLHQVAFDYKKRFMKGFGIRFVSDYALKRAAQIADFDPYAVQPIESVKAIEQPIFIAHGDADKRISFSYGKALFDNLKAKDKTWYPIKGGTHMNLSKKGGQAYRKALFSFIDRNIKAESTTL